MHSLAAHSGFFKQHKKEQLNILTEMGMEVAGEGCICPVSDIRIW